MEQENTTIDKVFSLKKRALKRWIYDNEHTQPYVAKKIHISADEFKRKLREREPFEKEQIRRLVYLMGAEAAFNVLYFPNPDERKRVQEEVFGKKKGD